MGAELNRPPEGSTNTVPARAGHGLHGPYQSSAETGAHHGARTMRALVQHRYGSPDVLSVAEVPRPVPGAGEVLVRVQAASVNARDWHIMRGEPWLARLDRTTFGRLGPKVKVRGTDFAGIVESIGASVTRWRRGDAVFGESSAAIAEYVTTSADLLAAIPPSTTFEI